MNHLSYLIYPCIMFIIGIFGVFSSRMNLLVTLMCLESMLLSINVVIVLCSVSLDSSYGLMFAMLLLCVGAAETAIGLSLVVAFHKHQFISETW